MINRSDIDLVGVSTCGENIGSGIGIYKCKNTTGNTLQFKSISVTGSSLSIVATGDTIIISGGSTGGGLPVLTGMTNYVLRVNSTGMGIESSSIFDSGATNIYIAKNNIFIGSSNSPTTIKPQGSGCMCLVAQGGVIIGNLTNSIFTNGSDLCSRTCNDLIIGAGSATVSGIGKKLYLRGGTGISASGGTVVICGGSGSSNGRIQTPNLPAKSTETCVVYIDAGGNLSKGVVSTGITISGIATRIPVFNATGNNISATTMSFIANTLCNPNDLTIQVANTKNIFLHAPISANANQITLGSPNMVNTINANMVQSCGMASDISLRLFAKGNGQVSLHAPVVFLGNNGTFGLKYTQIGGALEFPIIGRICSCNGDQYNPEAKSMTLMGGCGYGAPTFAGSGATVYICGGDAASGTGTAKAGGSVAIKAGLGVSGGANGRVILTGLPAKTTESCVVYIDSTGKLSAGVSSGGTGSTGATNGIGWSNLTNGSTVAGCGTPASGGTICTNTLYGVSAGANITDGTGNIAIGTEALCGNISGGDNVAIGYGALSLGISGCSNIAIGNDALRCNTSGINNIAVGVNTLTFNTGGTNNIAIGFETLFSNISGDNNIANGLYAMYNNLDGASNIAFGVEALCGNISGCSNIALGCQTLYTNIGGCYNIALGSCALNKNTSGNNNIAHGYTSLCSNTTGRENIGIGHDALRYNTEGNYNVSLGTEALAVNICGCNNVAMGLSASTCNISGCSNVAIGPVALACNIGGCCNVAIGICAGFYEQGSHKLHISNSADKSLIYGEFDNEKLCIRGKTYISGLTNTTKSDVIYYDSGTKELTYGASPSGGVVFNNDGNVGTSLSIDWNLGVVRKMTLTGNTTFTFSNPTSGGTYSLILAQDATGSRCVTFPTVKWSSGITPVLTTTGNAIDIVSLLYDGINYYGIPQNNFS